MLCYDMIYDIIWYLLQLSFHQAAVVGKLVQNKKETAVYKRKNHTQNSTKTQNTQDRKQTYKTRKET